MFPNSSNSWIGSFIILVIRSLILIPVQFDGTRLANFVFLLGFTILNSLHVVTQLGLFYVKNLPNRNDRQLDFLITTYQEASMVYKKLQFCFESCIYILITIVFWAIVACGWVAVRGFGKLSFELYSAFVIFGGAFAIGKFYVLPKFTKICETFHEFVELARKNAKFLFKSTKAFGVKIKMKQTIALMPIKVRYGTFFVFQKEFVIHQFSTMLERTFDAIMLIVL